MKAQIIHVSQDDAETIRINGHEIQYGGSDGDGYCYTHQSFSCVSSLSKEEQDAVEKASWYY